MQNSHRDSFFDSIRDIIESEEYRKMQAYRHHMHSSTYDHSIKVAYLCYLHYHKFHSKVNLEELLRAALLHDYFLYDWRDKNDPNNRFGLIHGFTHPKQALKNALNAYPDLTETEQDTIKRHMFPLTPIPPKTRCGWLICFYDKVAAIDDYCHRTNWLKAVQE